MQQAAYELSVRGSNSQASESGLRGRAIHEKGQNLARACAREWMEEEEVTLPPVGQALENAAQKFTSQYQALLSMQWYSGGLEGS
ncbi:hypothetical protein PG996_008197 [Apiospora saccharicola]|uniref:Uncharacterized protein n=1 Tax=Apiospora saccharicola TaxID=335842 RepID=A0ABR1UZR7_9PEZI